MIFNQAEAEPEDYSHQVMTLYTALVQPSDYHVKVPHGNASNKKQDVKQTNKTTSEFWLTLYSLMHIKFGCDIAYLRSSSVNSYSAIIDVTDH